MNIQLIYNFKTKKCFERKNKQAHIPDATPLLDIDKYNEWQGMH